MKYGAKLRDWSTLFFCTIRVGWKWENRVSWGWTGLGRRSNGRDAGRGPVQQLVIVEFEGDDGQFEIPAATFALSLSCPPGGLGNELESKRFAGQRAHASQALL